MTRSDFLRDGLKHLFRLTADRVEAKANKMVVPLHRPPGAVDELAFLSNCTRCDRCIEACPYDAIVRADAKYGSAVDTPMIIPADAPCYLCEEMPCIGACPENALLQPTNKVKMGTAHIVLNKCFAHTGQADSCDYCFTRCPLKNEAIVMDERKPRIIGEACTGCGICEYFCPAPGKAVRILTELS